ncbi:MAG TPA: hypothetical protein VIK33_00425 [Anaerolineae bacterium]
MDNQATPLTLDYAVEVKSFLARYGLTAEALMDAVRADENGRAFNSVIAFGGLIEGLTERNEKERAPRVFSHLQRALTPQPSGRWTPLITRRAAGIKREASPLLAEAFAGLYRDPHMRPAVWLKAFVEACDANIRTLEQQRSEALARMRQAEKELEPLQTRINDFLRANASRRTITHLIEMLTTLLQVVDRGVGVTAVVLMAERLVNDREAHALTVDATAAAIGVLQEARGQAQREREKVGQFVTRCRTVSQRVATARSTVQAQLVAHPYADVDLTDAALAERLQAQIETAPLSDSLARVMDMDEDELFQMLYDAALAQARRQTATWSLLELMEMQAADLQTRAGETLPAGDDLVAATLEAAYRRIDSRAVELERRAAPQGWWLVGVPDETNSGFAFENSTLVGTGRRDQVQFLHVEIGIVPEEITAFIATREAFERASAQRNYYVFEALATDDRARQTFALGLASGVIAVRGGTFALVAEDGDTTLGAAVEEAFEQFGQRANLIEAAEHQINALPLAAMAERLETYLARGRGVQDELWWEFASYVRDRLELVRHQMTFASERVS